MTSGNRPRQGFSLPLALPQPLFEEMSWQPLSPSKRSKISSPGLPGARCRTAREHTVPLSDSAVEILHDLPRIADSGLVFTLSGRNRITAFHRTKQRLDALMLPGTPAWTLHDLRRTFASGCARLGINLPVIEKLLNHVSGSFAGVQGIYQRYSFADEKCTAMQAWGRYVDALVTGAPAANVFGFTKK
jgi:integrase